MREPSAYIRLWRSAVKAWRTCAKACCRRARSARALGHESGQSNQSFKLCAQGGHLAGAETGAAAPERVGGPVERRLVCRRDGCLHGGHAAQCIFKIEIDQFND